MVDRGLAVSGGAAGVNWYAERIFTSPRLRGEVARSAG